MTFKRLHCCALILLCGASSVHAADSSDVLLLGRTQETALSPGVKSPLLLGTLSAVLPGAGQFYTRHYIKGVLFLGAEISMALYSRYWFQNYQTQLDNAAPSASLRAQLPETGQLENDQEVAIGYHDALSAKYSMYVGLSWLVGGHLWNVGNAVQGSGFFTSDATKNPQKAALLAAVPALGLGQLYNESISKAGMIMMVQTTLGGIAYTNHRLMRDAESHLVSLLTADDSLRTQVAAKYKDEWEYRRGNAYRNRNSFLWYSLFFYFYGILDAVVDAHLHDYPRKIRAYPDLVPEQGAVRMNFNYQF